jgi:hypothetical protein
MKVSWGTANSVRSGMQPMSIAWPNRILTFFPAKGAALISRTIATDKLPARNLPICCHASRRVNQLKYGVQGMGPSPFALELNDGFSHPTAASQKLLDRSERAIQGRTTLCILRSAEQTLGYLHFIYFFSMEDFAAWRTPESLLVKQACRNLFVSIPSQPAAATATPYLGSP